MRKTVSITLSILSVVIALAAIPAMAKKPPVKRVVLGTTQLNGDQAKPGVTYTLGKTDPLNVTLDSMEYTVEPMMIDSAVYATNADQKLLVLHYTLHNPNPRDRGLAWSTFEINAVDANDTNWRYVTDVGMAATRERCNMSLKRAQKTKVYTVIVVPAKGALPKLMIQSSDKLVLRYDLRGKVKPLPAPIADPADATGATALENVPAQMGVFYPMRDLMGKIDSVAFSDIQFKGRPAGKGKRYLVILGAAKNTLTLKKGFAWSTFRPKLVDADGGEISWNGSTVYPSRDDSINANIEPGQEVSLRWIYEVPDKLGLRSLSVKQGDGRAYVYDLSGAK